MGVSWRSPARHSPAPAAGPTACSAQTAAAALWTQQCQLPHWVLWSPAAPGLLQWRAGLLLQLSTLPAEELLLATGAGLRSQLSACMTGLKWHCAG
jgi:hypothetical protein